jgi:hypothetical protein
MEILLFISIALNVVLGIIVCGCSLSRPPKPTTPTTPSVVPFAELSFKVGDSIPNKFGLTFVVGGMGAAGVVMKDAGWNWDTGALIYRKANSHQQISWYNFLRAFPQFTEEIQSFSSEEARERFLAAKEYTKILSAAQQELKA